MRALPKTSNHTIPVPSAFWRAEMGFRVFTYSTNVGLQVSFFHISHRPPNPLLMTVFVVAFERVLIIALYAHLPEAFLEVVIYVGVGLTNRFRHWLSRYQVHVVY